MLADNRNRATYANEGGHNWCYRVFLAGEQEIDGPSARDEKAQSCPNCDSVFHAAPPAVEQNRLIKSRDCQGIVRAPKMCLQRKRALGPIWGGLPLAVLACLRQAGQRGRFVRAFPPPQLD